MWVKGGCARGSIISDGPWHPATMIDHSDNPLPARRPIATPAGGRTIFSEAKPETRWRSLKARKQAKGKLVGP